MNILVTNTDLRKSLTVIRDIHENNTLYALSPIRNSIGSKSKYIKREIVLKTVTVNKILEIIHEYTIDFIFPCDDDTVEFFSEHIESFSNVIIPIPGYESFRICRDKSKTIKHAQQYNVPVPHTIEVDDLVELKKTIQKTDITYPVVLKPKESAGSRGLRKCNSKEELLTIIDPLWNEYGKYIIQEFIPLGGSIIDAVYLYNQGTCVASFVDKRLRTYPPRMGACTLGESIHHQKALAQGKKLLDSLHWNGLAMVEYREDPRNGELVLMEINPRLWGSIELPVFSGIRFPYITIKAFSEVLTNSGSERGQQPQTDYPDGYKMRWFGDVLSIIKDKEFSFWKKIQLLVLPTKGPTAHQIFKWHDMKPFIYFLTTSFLNMLKPSWRKKQISR